MPKVSIPEDFICPLTQELMKEPVATSDGQIYERAAIEKWLESHDTSPLTNNKLAHKNLMPIPLIKRQIQPFLEKICTEEQFFNAFQQNDMLNIDRNLHYTQSHLEAKDKDGLTSLERAIYQGLEGVVDFFEKAQALKEGYVSINESVHINIYIRTYKVSPLTLAVRKGCEKVASLLLKEGAKLEGEGNNTTPLSLAAQLGHEGLVKLLLAQNADIEAKDYLGKTPLWHAAEHGHTNVVKLLLVQKADIEAKAIESFDNFKNRIFFSQSYVANYNQARNSCVTPLHIAAYHGHIEIVKLLLAEKADLEAKTVKETINFIYGMTPLHMAVVGGHIESVKLLLAEKVNLEATTAYDDPIYRSMNGYSCAEGMTPLYMAVVCENLEIVKLLLAAKANLEVEYYPGFTPLRWAADINHEDLVKLLLVNGANYKACVYYQGQEGTPAQLAESRKKTGIAKLITDYSQQLEAEARRAPQEIIELKKVINQQQEEIRQLKEQLNKILKHLELSDNDKQLKSTSSPGFFKS